MMPTYSERSHSPIMLENHKILILNIIKLKTIIKFIKNIKKPTELKISWWALDEDDDTNGEGYYLT